MKTEEKRNQTYQEQFQDTPPERASSYEDPAISRWLKFAKRMLDNDDDPTPSPA